MQSVKGYGQLFTLAANTTIELLIRSHLQRIIKRLTAEVREGCFVDKLYVGFCPASYAIFVEINRHEEQV
jgi:hypothetical protein